MKKALSIIEVLISILLISVVIASLLSLKSNNLSLLEKSYEKERYNSYISVLAYDYENINNRNKNIFVSDKINIKDDDLKRELNSIKVNVKDEIKGTKVFDEMILSYQVIKSKYTIEDKTTKVFFTIRLVD